MFVWIRPKKEKRTPLLSSLAKFVLYTIDENYQTKGTQKRFGKSRSMVGQTNFFKSFISNRGKIDSLQVLNFNHWTFGLFSERFRLFSEWFGDKISSKSSPNNCKVFIILWKQQKLFNYKLLFLLFIPTSGFAVIEWRTLIRCYKSWHQF